MEGPCDMLNARLYELAPKWVWSDFDLRRIKSQTSPHRQVKV